MLFSCAVGAAIDTCMNWIVEDHPIPREVLVEEINTFIIGGAVRLGETTR